MIDEFTITKNAMAMFHGAKIIAPYAIVTILKNDRVFSKRLFVVPADEYQEIKKLGTGNKYHSMMAKKMVLRRVLKGIFSMIGTAINEADATEIENMATAMRVDNEEEATPQKYRTTEDIGKLTEKHGGKDKFIEKCKSIGYVGTEDTKLSTLLIGLTEEKYQEFLGKLEGKKELKQPKSKPQAKKLEFYRGDKELKELSNKYGGNEEFVAICKKIGYIQTEDMRLSTLIKSLDNDEYRDFLGKLEEAKNV